MTDSQTASSTTNLGHRLPVELIEEICILAAEEDRRCAHQMAFVSKSICRITAIARWRVIAITSFHQLIALYQVLQAVRSKELDAAVRMFRHADSSITISQATQFLLSCGGEHEDTRRLRDALASVFEVITPTRSKDVRIKRRASTISLPSSGEPHEFMRHLFIDLPKSKVYLSPPSDIGDRWDAFLATGWEALHGENNHRVYENNVLSRAPHIVSTWKEGVIERLLEGLDGLALDHLSLGVNATSVLHKIDGKATSIKEMTAVITGPHGCQYLKVESLQRLHLIGVDPESKTSGMSPPWAYLDSASRGGKFLRRLTHLRYDTRKFSFKPAEIFATRLRIMLQEYTVESQSSSRAEVESVDSYSHNGPRHAAPTRNAGYRHQLGIASSSLTPVHHMRGDARADYLREEMGVGRLDFLQFAWDPMSTSEKREEDIPAHQRARYSALNQQNGGAEDPARDTGGWPRERRGAWTERSDRDVAPSFGVELRDAINALYGWHTPGIEAAGKFLARKETLSLDELKLAKNVAFSPDHAVEMISRIRDGFREEDRLHLSEMQSKLSNEMTRQGLEVPCKLQYGIRAPQSLIHLGGKVPFEPEDRLALFEDRARGGKGAWP